MNPSKAFTAWFFGIFVWVYICPVLVVGTLICLPYFMLVTPVLVTVSLTSAYILKDHIISEGILRDILNEMPYESWFGHVDTLETLSSPHLITSHPHGFLCTSILFAAHFRKDSTTVFAVSPWLFMVPFVGWVAKHLGCIPAEDNAILSALKSTSVILVPGGVPELVTQTPYTRRHGFLRVARTANVPILPIVTTQSHFTGIALPCLTFRTWIAKQYGIPLMMPMFGWYGTWLPKRLPVYIQRKPPFHVRTNNLESERRRYYASLDM